MFYHKKKSGDCEVWFGDCEITSVAKMATVNFRICRALLECLDTKEIAFENYKDAIVKHEKPLTAATPNNRYLIEIQHIHIND